MSGSDFFDAPEKQSLVKSELVNKYFGAWARVIIKHRKWDKRLAFVDLFSGPGAYEDGTPSTPLQLLARVINDSAFRENVVTVFNDRDPKLARALRQNIANLASVTTLAYSPRVMNLEVGNEIFDHLADIEALPALYFIDPFGYKGVNLDLIGKAIRGWGSECILFFNYNRINLGMNNPDVAPLIAGLFGESRFRDLQRSVERARNSSEREQMIIASFEEAIVEVGGTHVLEFKFRSLEKDRTSHYIFFITKNRTGHKIMKDIMHNLSTDGGAIRRAQFAPPLTPQLPLFSEGWQDASDPYSMAALKGLLCTELTGQSLSVQEVCKRFTVDHPYVERNVRAALNELESEGLVDVDKPSSQRRRGDKVTLADHRVVTFK